MTLGEGKRKVLMLIDEYSSGGTITPDKDIDAKMIDFFDLAQKNVAQYKKIIRRFSPGEGEHQPDAACHGGMLYPAPADFSQVFRVWKDGKKTGCYPWIGKSILMPPADALRVTVEYFAVPATIPDNAEDSYPFEVDEDAAACMPYFVAAQQLVVDLILDPAPLLELYDRMVASLDLRLPGGGGGGIRQGLYR